MNRKIQQDSANLWEYIDFVKPQIEESLRKFLFSQDERVEEEIILAFEHTLLFGSDRLRGVLTLLAAELVGGRIEKVLPAAVSVEYIYASAVVLENLLLRDEFYQRDKFSDETSGRAFSLFVCLDLLNKAYDLVFVNRRFEFEKALEAHSEIVGCISSVRKFAEKVYEYKEISTLNSGFRETVSMLLIRLSIRIGAILEGADYLQLSILSRFAESFSQAYLLSEKLIKQKGKDRILRKKLEEASHEASRILAENFPPSQARSRLVQLAEYLTERKV